MTTITSGLFGPVKGTLNVIDEGRNSPEEITMRVLEDGNKDDNFRQETEKSFHQKSFFTVLRGQ